jgi:hypothetical protein
MCEQTQGRKMDLGGVGGGGGNDSTKKLTLICGAENK